MAESGVITGEALHARAAALPGWNVEEEQRLCKTFRFPNFQTALDFVNRVGAAAEELGHHPDLHLAWGRVDATTWSHDAGGITERDFALAARIDEAFSQG
ncbi:MAG TPA: 4a-hydroxytetrahydrobiopterin dehydratase [Bryobacteraceae bacterium]|nr:4a-hydroxytetrahydrobiopterin dehydratase [Bryobacteraceae bacterium]